MVCLVEQERAVKSAPRHAALIHLSLRHHVSRRCRETGLPIRPVLWFHPGLWPPKPGGPGVPEPSRGLGAYVPLSHIGSAFSACNAPEETTPGRPPALYVLISPCRDILGAERSYQNLAGTLVQWPDGGPPVLRVEHTSCQNTSGIPHTRSSARITLAKTGGLVGRLSSAHVEAAARRPIPGSDPGGERRH